MSARVDLSVRTLYDQIWAYAHFIDEAQDVQDLQQKYRSTTLKIQQYI